MPQYIPNTSSFAPGQVGGLYNVGIGDGTRSYGYVFQNQGQQSGGFQEETNIADKDKLIQYSSPNLIDRDLAFYPRVTQGDFSGGGLQLIFLDPTKYFDSDLEIRTPGYLTLRPGWKRNTLTASVATAPQSVVWNNDVFTVVGTATYYNSAGTGFAPGITANFIDTDGQNLYLADGTNTIKYTINNSTYANMSINTGTLKQMWAINLGTNGRFIYFNNGAQPDQLFKLDTTSPPVSPVQVPTGNTLFSIVDVVAYLNSIAILTKDTFASRGCDLWFHDGTNMTRIVRLEQYVPTGFANCLGDLYVTAQSQGSFEGPVLLKVSASSFEVVARFSSPLTGATAAGIGNPAVSGQYVYFALTNPQINNVTSVNHVAVFDVLTGAVSHLGNLDTLDNPPITQPRQLTAIGRSAAFPMTSGGSTFLQYQTNNNKLPAGNAYVPSGTAVSSKKDFGTPGIPKRFRRIEAVHSPLAAGESIKVSGYIDQDPLAYTSALTPTATITNSTLNSTLTALTFGADTVGRTEFDAVTLAGNGSSTPKLNRVAVEIGGTYTWPLDLDCTNQRRLLNQATVDPQGITGKDLYYLLRNSYENGNLMTLYLAENVSYTVTIESLKARNPAYVDHQQAPVKADEEWLVSVVLKQVA